MNYLAHAYLSFGRPKILIGNLIGDSVRGAIEKKYEPEIVLGIKLHRAIDAYTDSHPVVKEAQLLLRPNFGRYSTVITDMYFDHFLSKFWNNYHPQPLNDFAQEVYLIVDQHADILPEKFIKMYGNIRLYNMLVKYGEFDGIRRALQGMAKRTTFNSNMETAHKFLDQHHEFFRLHFGDFFEDLVAYSKASLNELINSNFISER
ncbi:acyl carrier protein phosphodiesterase [Mongoliitalea lutea]|uniref:acyl carrier protein phosphodiesterase n=1 Tax=Mongoliitalea lutea TaxID=849756 RepID=UPI001672446B|nr:ACP phosphodiesterase [Mongoliitalea lutea]